MGQVRKGRIPRIVVVDDDPAVRHLLVQILRDEGFDPVEASNGAEALEVVRREPPDLILLDLAMPVMDGRTFYREIHQDGAAGAPVMILSATGARRAQREVGADAAMSKPFDPDHLIVEIRRLVSA